MGSKNENATEKSEQSIFQCSPSDDWLICTRMSYKKTRAPYVHSWSDSFIEEEVMVIVSVGTAEKAWTEQPTSGLSSKGIYVLRSVQQPPSDASICVPISRHPTRLTSLHIWISSIYFRLKGEKRLAQNALTAGNTLGAYRLIPWMNSTTKQVGLCLCKVMFFISQITIRHCPCNLTDRPK